MPPGPDDAQTINYRSYAMRYLLAWVDTERAFWLAVQDRRMDESERLRQLQLAASHFAIARTLRLTSPTPLSTHDRYRPLLALLDLVKLENLRSGHGHPVAQFEQALQTEYRVKSRLTSLSSKFLWLKFRQGFVIRDSRVRVALGLPEGTSYQEYESMWWGRFRRDQSQIQDACDDLATALRFVRPETGPEEPELHDTVASQWFHERVLDMALWHGGRRTPP